MFKMICILSLLASVCSAKIEDHFKKVENKDPNVHRLRNVDFIYMINMDVRPDKYRRSIDQLTPFGIHPCRFSAVNGWQLGLDAINDVGLKYAPGMAQGMMGTSYLTSDLKPEHAPIQNVGQTYFLHHLPLGAIGICLSHLSILQDALDSGYETIWVMEDDIEVLKDPREIPNVIDRLDQCVGKGNWDILFTDQDFRDSEGKYVPCYGYAERPDFVPSDPSRFMKKIQINEEFREIGSRFGAHSMIMRRSGIAKVLNFIKEHKIFLPLDMDNYIIDDIHLYTVVEDIVGNLPGAPSDNRSPSYRD